MNVLNGDLPFPSLILRDSALTANIGTMARWCAENGFLLAPHGKTTMCPQIFARQIEAGAWAMTVANMTQALVCLDAGIKRVLIANQVVDEASIRALAAADAEIYCLVDSVAGVERLAAGLEKAGARRSLGVLIEIGRTGWRTGARSEEHARRVFDAIQRVPALAFRGFEAFEGMAKSAEEAAEFLGEVVGIAERITPEEGLIFSAGGSSHLGPVQRAFRSLRGGWTCVLRSGCYVTHDHGIYAKQQAAALAADPTLPLFEAALELWACVQSMPDPGVAILTFGKRDCAYDISLPVPLDLQGAVVTAVNDQHAYLSYPAGAGLSVGDKVRLGISHPCTAFDKWRMISLVDDDYNVIDSYRTFF